MAHLEAGGGVAGEGVAGGEQDVPDVRFLLRFPKIDVGNKSKDWIDNNLNSPLKKKMSFEEKEALFIDYLESVNFGKDETQIVYEIPTTNGMNMQGDAVNGMNLNACALLGGMNRKRRHYLFLMLMLLGTGKLSKLAHTSKVEVPAIYQDPAQLKRLMKKVHTEYEELNADLLILIDQIKVAGGRPVKVPGLFSKPFELSKPPGLAKGKKK